MGYHRIPHFYVANGKFMPYITFNLWGWGDTVFSTTVAILHMANVIKSLVRLFLNESRH